MFLRDKRILITGGTGSLGRALVTAILSGAYGRPGSVTVFSRGEVKQHEMRLEYNGQSTATDEVIYDKGVLRFVIGDVRDYAALCDMMRSTDVVIHAAALKQVPTCEYAPREALATNVIGAQNIIRAAQSRGSHAEIVVAISSDKAVKPVNVYGMTKALQERMFCTANLRHQPTRFVCARYGNVLGSRGSVIPLFQDQIRQGGPVTLTAPGMTRFWQGLDDAVDTVLVAIAHARPGEVWVRQTKAARMDDLAAILIGDADVAVKTIGRRPGEKLHEVLVSSEECSRVRLEGDHYVIAPLLPELQSSEQRNGELTDEYTSAARPLSREALEVLLRAKGILS